MASLSTASVALYRDRHDAGRRLARALEPFAADMPIVEALPRGGVPVAYEVAAALDAPLDVVLVRKLGAPGAPEYAIGAIGEDHVLLVNQRAVEQLGLAPGDIERTAARERIELDRRRLMYRGGEQPLNVRGRTVILVDDGLATGSTARAAARVLRGRGAARIVLAVPVGPPESIDRISAEVDEVVCLSEPSDFFAVGVHYEQFGQVTDEEVRTLLRRRRRRAHGASAPIADPAPRATGGVDLDRIAVHPMRIDCDGVELAGDLRVPPAPRGLVIFADAGGSSRRSPRSLRMASALHAGRMATLLFDLLTGPEATDSANVFDVELLAARLMRATALARTDPAVADLPVGYFGASTGAAAALDAAAQLEGEIGAVVLRSGRPDLAERLAGVTAPTLLVVGGADRTVLVINASSARMLRCPYRLAIVLDATHEFEEPGALEEVAALASGWFSRHLANDQSREESPCVPMSTGATGPRRTSSRSS